MILEFLLGIGSNAAYSATKHSIRKLVVGSPLNRAIDATASEFNNPLIKDALRSWCNSEAFLGAFESIQSKKLTTDDFDELESFVEIGQYSDGIQSTYDSALKVLTLFRRKLEEELLRSEDGLLLISKLDERRYQDVQSRLDRIEGKIRGPLPRVLTSEGESRVSYDNKATWSNHHRLRYFVRQGREIEIDLKRATPLEPTDVLTISIVFGFPIPWITDSHELVRRLLDSGELAPRYGQSWLTEGVGRPYKGRSNVREMGWFLDGAVLLKEVPELTYLRWIKREFPTYPTRSQSYDYDEPRDAPKVSFTLKQTDLRYYDEELDLIRR